MAKPVTANLHQLDGLDFEYVPANADRYISANTPGQASALNAGIAALRLWEDRSDKAYVGACLARLLLGAPDVLSFTATLRVCAAVDDEGVVHGETAVAVVDPSRIQLAPGAVVVSPDQCDGVDPNMALQLMRLTLEGELDSVGYQITRIVMYQPKKFRRCRVIHDPHAVEIEVRRERVRSLLRAERISGLSVFHGLFD